MEIKEINCVRRSLYKSVFLMVDAATQLPVKTETTASLSAMAADWQPFEVLRSQVDRLFHDFQTGFPQVPSLRSLLDIEPFWRRDLGFNVTPAIDIVEKEKTRLSSSPPNCRALMPRTSAFSFPTAR